MLFKKMLRDLKNNIMQFFTIFAMVLIAALVYVGVTGYSDGMKKSVDDLLEEANMPDLWVSGKGFSKNDLKKIENTPGVNSAMRFFSAAGTGDVTYSDGRKESFSVPMEGYFIDADIEEIKVNKLVVTEGVDYDKNADGLWLGRKFANARDLHPGDRIRFTYEDAEIEKEILGIVTLPDHSYVVSDPSVIFQEPESYGWAVMSMDAFPAGALYDSIIESEEMQSFLSSVPELEAAHDAGMSWRDILVTSLSGMEKGADLKKAVELAPDIISDRAGTEEKHDFIKALNPSFNLREKYIYPQMCVDVEGEAPGIYALDKGSAGFNERLENVKNAIYKFDFVDAVTERGDCASYASVKSEAEEGDTYSDMFTFLFIFIAALSVITTMNRFVKKQRMQIGAMKALGFRDTRITRHYVSYGFFVSLMGAIAGFIIGVLFFAPAFYRMEDSMYDMPGGGVYIDYKNYVMTAVIVLMVTAVTYFSCKKILSEPAAQTLRLEVPKVKVKKTELKAGSLSSKLSFSVKWNLRDIKRSKARSAMAVVGVMGSTLLIVMAFGMKSSMLNYIDWEFDQIMCFKSRLSFESDVSDSDRMKVYREYGTATSQTVAIEYVDGNGKLQVSTIQVNDSDGMVKVSDHNKITHDIDEGIPGKTYCDVHDPGVLYATEKLVKNKGLDINTPVHWHILGDDKWYDSMIASVNRDPQMQTFSMTRAAFEGIGEEYEPDMVYTMKDLSGVDDKDIDGVSNVSTIASLKEQVDGMLNMMSSMLGLFIFMSVIMGFIIIYNMGLLALNEKMYQFATLKVLGFTFKKLVRVYTQQNVWVCGLGILLGLPAGFGFTNYLFLYAIGEDYDFNAYIEPQTYLIAALGTILVMLFTSVILARSLKKIDMVASLKANE